MGEYFEQEIQPKLGVEVYLRMDPGTMSKVRELQSLSMMTQLKNGQKSWEDGRYASMSCWDMCCKTGELLALNKNCNKGLAEGNRKIEEHDFSNYKDLK